MNRWQQVQELFDETVALSAHERARVLSRRAGADAELVRQVEALVAADASPLPALDRSAGELLHELRAEAAAALCGTACGAYRIEEHVASGGMAHVYRATRSIAGTERRVALKVLREGLDTEAFLRRFQRERETLAALEHEHVVAFLDAGSLPDGRPYLVMEFVDGVPLTAWARGRSLRQRLHLFLKVLDTVEYAHARLVVHRDLKPSNVLVTAAGVPKLLDFGVATVLEGEPQAEPGLGPMTPSYASPEQRTGGAVSTASDVYSLGVLLGEIACGDHAPAPPAADLRHIVARACVEDPEHRYRSAFDLAEDLRRFLRGEPIAARRGSWGYRARLFTVRHRWPLVVAAAVLVSLVVGWISADLERRSARQDASLGWGAHGQAKVAARLYERWITTAAAADPDLADRAAADLERALLEDLAALPEAETLVRMTLARIHLDRGDRVRAAAHAERAWELAQRTRGVGKVDRERAAALRRLTRAGG